MKKNVIISIFLVLLQTSKILSYHIKENKINEDFILTNFTFGSGYLGRYSTNYNIFETINKHNSNLFIWLGNIIYLNTPNYFSFMKNTIKNNWTKGEKLYNKVKDNKYYKILEKKIPIIGIWDEYDYGIYNGNKYFKDKEISKHLFLKFLNYSSEEISEKNKKGIFSTYSFGKGYKSVRIILLDLRYYKSSFFNILNYDNLGKEQWIWLENIFKNNNETLTFIGSSIQILPINRFLTESWYINSRKKLFELIAKYKKKGIIFLSGNVNFSQILKTFCVNHKIGYNLYEITSSSLSFNNYNFYGNLIDNILPNDYNLGKSFHEINFGEIIIDWGNNINDIFISLNIYDKDNNKKINLNLKYNDLVFNRNNSDDSNCEYLLNKRFKKPKDIFYYYYNNKKYLPIGLVYFLLFLFLIQMLTSKKNIVIFISGCILFMSFIIGYLYKVDLAKEETLNE